MDDQTTLAVCRAVGHVLNGNPDRARELMAPLDPINRAYAAQALADLTGIVTGIQPDPPVFHLSVLGEHR